MLSACVDKTQQEGSLHQPGKAGGGVDEESVSVASGVGLSAGGLFLSAPKGLKHADMVACGV